MLKVNDLKVVYNGNIKALKGVNLEVNKGEIVVLIGANGAGKTTLLRALTGLTKAESESSAILDLSEDVKYSCNCVSFVWSGVSFFATQEDASLIPNNSYPKKWDKYRAGALCCKHLSGLFRTLSFQIPKMSQSIRKNMREQGLID